MNSDPEAKSEINVSILSDLFNKKEKPHKTSISGISQLPAIPGLYISDIGSVPLPICDEQFSKLMSLYNTNLNLNKENKNNCFISLHPSQFYFTHPDWNENIIKLLQSVCLSLGCDHNKTHFIEAHLDKLIIYNNNYNINNNYSNNTNDKILFATLIIQLPSNYTTINNKPVLIAQNNKYDFGTDNNNASFNTYYCGYLNNISLKRNQITNGRRMCIIYKLYWKGPTHTSNYMPHINSKKMLNNEINSILSKWNERKCVAISLKHQYNENDFVDGFINKLKGIDSIRISILKKHINDIILFIAKLDPKTDNIPNKWFDENGKQFEFAEDIYSEIDLNTDCICYINHNDIDKNNFKIKNKNRFIVIIMRKCYQFDIIARNSIDAAISFVEEVFNLDNNKNIKYEMSYIVNELDYDDPVVFTLLRKKKYHSLAIDFIDKIIKQGSTFDTTSIIDSIIPLIIDYGWIDDLKTSVLKIIDNGDDYDYILDTELIRSFKEKRISIDSVNQRGVMICAFIRMNSTKRQFNLIPNDIIKCINIMYTDCGQDIADRIWQNAINKNFNINYIFSIYKFIILYQWNKEKQTEMMTLMDIKYDASNHDGATSQSAKELFIIKWVDHLLSIKNRNKITYTQGFSLLMNKFDPLYTYKSTTITNILSLLNLNQFIEFVNDKLIHHNITKYYTNKEQQTHRNNYYYQNKNKHSVDSYTQMIESIGNIIKSNQWNKPFKIVILKLMDSINYTNISGIKTVNLLIKQISKETNRKDEDDGDIIMLTNKGNICCQKLNEIKENVWHNMIKRFCLNNNGILLKELCTKYIAEIIKFMAKNVDENNKNRQEIFDLFNNAYSQNVTQERQCEVAYNIMLCNDKSLLKSAHIQNIFIHRIRYLSCLKEPKFSWKMLINEPNIIVNDSSFTEFLKSERETYKHGVGTFNNIAHARKWKPVASNNGNSIGHNNYGYRTSYTFSYEAKGAGKRAYVLVSKTKNYFDRRTGNPYQRKASELKKLLNTLQ